MYQLINYQQKANKIKNLYVSNQILVISQQICLEIEIFKTDSWRIFGNDL